MSEMRALKNPCSSKISFAASTKRSRVRTPLVERGLSLGVSAERGVRAGSAVGVGSRIVSALARLLVMGVTRLEQLVLQAGRLRAVEPSQHVSRDVGPVRIKTQHPRDALALWTWLFVGPSHVCKLFSFDHRCPIRSLPLVRTVAQGRALDEPFHANSRFGHVQVGCARGLEQRYDIARVYEQAA